MISDVFHSLIYVPLYNALVFLLSVVPLAEVGIAVIVLTVIVKLLLFPLSLKAVRTQFLMREIEPETAAIKEKYKDNKEEQARRTMALYKEKGVNPFSSFLVLLIQLPIIFGLYFVFYKGGLPAVNTGELYSFILVPTNINMNFLGLVDMGAKSLVLALLAGVTQFIQAKLSLPLAPKKRQEGAAPSFQEDFTRGLHFQMRYVLPIVVTGVAYFVSAAVSLYWVTSNLFAIGQEFYVRRKIRPAYEKAPNVALNDKAA